MAINVFTENAPNLPNFKQTSSASPFVPSPAMQSTLNSTRNTYDESTGTYIDSSGSGYSMASAPSGARIIKSSPAPIRPSITTPTAPTFLNGSSSAKKPPALVSITSDKTIAPSPALKSVLERNKIMDQGMSSAYGSTVREVERSKTPVAQDKTTIGKYIGDTWERQKEFNVGFLEGVKETYDALGRPIVRGFKQLSDDPVQGFQDVFDYSLPALKRGGAKVGSFIYSGVTNRVDTRNEFLGGMLSDPKATTTKLFEEDIPKRKTELAIGGAVAGAVALDYLKGLREPKSRGKLAYNIAEFFVPTVGTKLARTGDKLIRRTIGKTGAKISYGKEVAPSTPKGFKTEAKRLDKAFQSFKNEPRDLQNVPLNRVKEIPNNPKIHNVINKYLKKNPDNAVGGSTAIETQKGIKLTRQPRDLEIYVPKNKIASSTKKLYNELKKVDPNITLKGNAIIFKKQGGHGINFQNIDSANLGRYTGKIYTTPNGVKVIDPISTGYNKVFDLFKKTTPNSKVAKELLKNNPEAYYKAFLDKNTVLFRYPKDSVGALGTSKGFLNKLIKKYGDLEKPQIPIKQEYKLYKYIKHDIKLDPYVKRLKPETELQAIKNYPVNKVYFTGVIKDPRFKSYTYKQVKNFFKNEKGYINQYGTTSYNNLKIDINKYLKLPTIKPYKRPTYDVTPSYAPIIRSYDPTSYFSSTGGYYSPTPVKTTTPAYNLRDLFKDYSIFPATDSPRYSSGKTPPEDQSYFISSPDADPSYSITPTYDRGDYPTYPDYNPPIISYPKKPGVINYNFGIPSLKTTSLKNVLGRTRPSRSPAEEKKLKEKQDKAYNILIRTKGKWTKVETPKTLNYFAAKNKGMQLVDNYAERSLKLVETKKKAQIKHYAEPLNAYKFDWDKSKKEILKKSFIEKSKYAIDSPGELRGITYKGIQASKQKKSKIKWLGL